MREGSKQLCSPVPSYGTAVFEQRSKDFRRERRAVVELRRNARAGKRTVPERLDQNLLCLRRCELAQDLDAGRPQLFIRRQDGTLEQRRRIRHPSECGDA